MGIRNIAKILKLKQLIARFNFYKTIRLNNVKFTVPIINNMGLLNLKLTEDGFFYLLKDLDIPEDSAFIDVGVNVGQTLLSFRSISSGTYYGFEPNPACVHYLNALIAKNNFKQTQILPIGLASETILAKFYLKNSVDSAGTIVGDLRPGYYEEAEATYVPLFVFDSLKLDNLKRISHIKIDVEGAELEVISGMVNTIQLHRPLIICEILDCHSEKSLAPMQERADKLISIIQSLNYDVYQILHKDRTISYKKLQKVKLNLWETKSFDLNDYVFIPAEKNTIKNRVAD